MALTGTIRRTVDLDKGVKCDHFERLFATADDEAHTFEITVTASGKPVDLTGAGVMGYFIRKDKETVVIRGSAASNVATLKLAESCYVEPGYFNLVIKASSGGKPVAVYWADGTVTRSSTDAIIDPGHEIPSLEELLAHIAEMEAATSAATSAAKSANDAAGKANTATSAANTAAGAANTAAQAANTAKTNADAATKAANNAAASATSAAGSATTAAGSANTAASSANTAAQAANTAKTNADAATKAANDAASAATTATTNANAATTKANAAAGLIENMTATAKKVAPGGNPSVDFTKETNPDRYNLALGLVTGDTGAAAGFGKVTASVDNNVGTPSVEVATSGENTAKNFDFKFHNLKGIPGEGAVSTVWGTQPDDAGDAKPEVGGRNLLLNSGEAVTNSNYQIKAWTLTKKETPKEGDVVTVSLKGTLGDGKTRFGLYNSNGNVGLCHLLKDSISSDGIYRKTFTWRTSGGNNTSLNVYCLPDSAYTDSTIEWIKLERGVVPTDWTPAPEDLYSADNPPPYPVTSVNGKTGAVTGLYDASNQPPYPVTSVNSETGAVDVDRIYHSSDKQYYIKVLNDDNNIGVSMFKPREGKSAEEYQIYMNKTTYQLGAMSFQAGVQQNVYSNRFPPPYPVTSVNGKTGAVTLDAAAVKARPDTWMPTASQVGAQPALGFTPVQQGGGAGQSTNKVYIGWSGSRLKAQVDSSDLGNFWFDTRPVIDDVQKDGGWKNGSTTFQSIYNAGKQGLWIAQMNPGTWNSGDTISGANQYGTIQIWHPGPDPWDNTYGVAEYIDRQNQMFIGTTSDNGSFAWTQLATASMIPVIPVSSVQGRTGAVNIFTRVWDSGLSPGANFPAQTLSCPGMSGHVLGFVLFGARSKTLPYYVQWFWYGQTGLWGKTHTDNAGTDIITRRMTPNFDNNTISFGSGYMNGSQDDTACVPISIYVCAL